jgi:hypothetical protein
MKNMRLSQLISSVFFLLLASGCILSLPQPSPTPVATAILENFPTNIPLTPSPIATETLLPTPTLSPQPQAISALVNVDVVNFRNGPGTVFNVLFKALKGTPLALLGKDQGSNWVLARSPEGNIGWIILTFITIQGDISNLPTLPIDYAYTIKGRVVDSSGAPIEGLTIAIYQQAGDGERRTDSTTLANGEFSAFVPLTEIGTWNVSVVGISCTSRIVDASCKYSGHFDPVYTTLVLPQQNLIEFIYQN